MTRPDDELLEAMRRGETGAVDEILARHEKQVYRFGLRMCGNPADAQEVLQETLLAAFKNLDSFRGEANLSTWLYQIARSFCTKLRRPHRDVRDGEPLEHAERTVADAAAGPDERAHAHEIGEALAVALAALPATYREAIVLRDVEGLSAEEAAAVVGIDVGALKSRLHRARLEMRAHLAGLLGTADAAETRGPTPCPELVQALAQDVDGEVDQATCRRIEEHLAKCARCAGACEALQRTVSLCRRIPGDEVPPPVRSAVRRAISGILAR